jgi:hypothetical protein
MGEYLKVVNETTSQSIFLSTLKPNNSCIPVLTASDASFRYLSVSVLPGNTTISTIKAIRENNQYTLQKMGANGAWTSTAISTVTASSTIRDMAWDSNLGYFGCSLDGYVQSSDGITWTPHLDHGCTFIIGGAGIILFRPSLGTTAYYYDGSFHTLSFGYASYNIGWCSYDGSRFICAMNSASYPRTYFYSTTGTTWTEATTPTDYTFVNGNGLHADYENNSTCSILSYTPTVQVHLLITTDGINWTNCSVPAVPVVTFACGNGIYLAICSGTQYYTSPSGNPGSWTSRTLPATAESPIITYNSGGFFYTNQYWSAYSTAGYFTEDGINWTASTLLATAPSTIYKPSQKNLPKFILLPAIVTSTTSVMWTSP